MNTDAASAGSGETSVSTGAAAVNKRAGNETNRQKGITGGRRLPRQYVQPPLRSPLIPVDAKNRLNQPIRLVQAVFHLAERWGFEPQNAFDTLHDFQSCALDQLSHLST